PLHLLPSRRCSDLCDAAAGFTVTLGCAAMVTEPTLAVMFFAPATVELNVPCISPFLSVVPDGVRVFPAPLAARFTVAPLTRLSKASRTVTVIVETLAPLLAVIALGAAVTDD